MRVGVGELGAEEVSRLSGVDEAVIKDVDDQLRFEVMNFRFRRSSCFCSRMRCRT